MSGRFEIKPVWLLIATFAILLLPNLLLSVTEPMSVLGRLCNVLLPAGVYLLLLSLSRNPARSVWMLFILIFLSAFQLVLLYLYGHSIIAVDMFLNLVTTNSAEVGELLGSMLPAVIGVVVLFVPILYFAAIRLRSDDFSIDRVTCMRVRSYGTTIALAGAACLFTAYASEDYSAKDDLYPVNVGYNLYLAYDRSERTAAYEITSCNFRYDAVCSHGVDSLREVYVMVIGETARAENFGLYGYNRATTPYLDREEGLIKFPQAYTQSNTTHKSVPMLMCAACADDYDRIYHEKGILTAFHEAGFHTSFISNQRLNHSFIDIFGKEADHCEFLKEELSPEGNLYDSDILEPLERILEDTTCRRQMIVLHTYGSHFKYKERYPREMAVFKPDMNDEVTASNREELMNAYDNTLVYTDCFLHSVIELLKRQNMVAAMIYTSDHGENIFDDERGLFLHASPRPSMHELHVPLLVWVSECYCDRYPDTVHNLQANTVDMVQTSSSVFHSMLDIGGITTPVLNDTLSIASANYVSRPHLYLTDRNIAKPVEEIIL